MRAMYRDDQEGARLRLEHLLEQHAVELPYSSQAFLSVHSARVGRIAFGVVTCVGACAMVVWAITSLTLNKGTGGGLSAILFGTWPVALFAYGVARLFAYDLARRAALRDLRPSGDIHADIARVEATAPAFKRSAQALEGPSLAWPMMGACLLAPLTLHFVLWLVVGRGPNLLVKFDEWIALSMIVVGHAHVALAALCWRFAQQARSAPTCAFGDGEELSIGWRVLGQTVLVSAVPGALLLGIPPILTAATGVLFVPLLFRAMRDAARRERSLRTTRRRSSGSARRAEPAPRAARRGLRR
jgi:hypothetical protein